MAPVFWWKMTPEVSTQIKVKALAFSRTTMMFAEISNEKRDDPPGFNDAQVAHIKDHVSELAVGLAQIVGENLDQFSPNVQSLSETIFAIKRRGEKIHVPLVSELLRGVSILDAADLRETTAVPTFVRSLQAIDTLI